MNQLKTIHQILMTLKAVFFDIDGTLLSFKTHKVPTSTEEAIRILKEKVYMSLFLPDALIMISDISDTWISMDSLHITVVIALPKKVKYCLKMY